MKRTSSPSWLTTMFFWAVVWLSPRIKRQQPVVPAASRDLAYSVGDKPLTRLSSWNLTWLGGWIPVPVKAQRCPQWYIVIPRPQPEDDCIVVRASSRDTEPPMYIRQRSGRGVSLHDVEEDVCPDIAVKKADSIAVSDARLCGNQGSLFREMYPEGVNVTRMVRLPTYARLRDVIPSILLHLDIPIDSPVACEDPASLYLYVLLDHSYDEVTFTADDILAVDADAADAVVVAS